MFIRISRILILKINKSLTVKNSTYTTKMSDNTDKGEILMLKGYPFYMKQPKEKMDLLFSKYESLLRKTLGDDVVAAYSMGSAAIPGMVGSPMIDILLCLKNAPPTEAQVRGICKSNGTENI